jgi:hypothetical protein
MPYGEPDILDDHAQVTERVRKLEVMHQSRTLRPKNWHPHNPTVDIALGHAVRVCGLNNILNPLDVRIPPEADYITNQVVGGFASPPVDEIFRFWLELGVGPAFWVRNLERMEGTAAGTPTYAFQTGDREQFMRQWIVFGPPFNQLSDETFAQVYVGDSASIVGGVGGTGAGSLPAHPGYPLIDGSNEALPIGGYYVGNQLSEDQRFYSIGSPPAPCTTDPIVSPFALSGQASPLTIPVGQADGGCPDNPAHPFGSSGQIEGFLYTVGLDKVTPHPSLGVPLDRYPAADGNEGGPNVGQRFVPYSTLRARMELALDQERFAGVRGFYATLAEVANAELRGGSRSAWQTLPLYPGWWGRIECRYDARFVYFRGSVFCGSATPTSEIFAAYPNHLPIGANTSPSAVLQAHTVNHQEPVLVGLSTDFRTGSPDDYQHGNGAYLGLYRPRHFSDLVPPVPVPGEPPVRGHTIVLDGCHFPIYQGPFDGSRPPYPDLRI